MNKILFATVAVAIVLGSFVSAIVTPADAEDWGPVTMQDFFWWSNVSDTVSDAELLPVPEDNLSITSNNLMFAETSIAYSVTIPASKDTAIGYCANWGPDTNNGNKPSFVAWNNSPTADLNSLIEFSLESIPADACIYQADLALYCFNLYGSSTIPVGVYKQLHTDWEESQATYNIYKTGASWTNQGGDYVTSDPAGTVMIVPPASQGFVQWNIIDIVNDARTRGIPVELLIKATAHGSDYSDAGFCSREYYQNTWLQPKLLIGYTLPATPTPTPTTEPYWSFAIITDTHVGRGLPIINLIPDYGDKGWDDSECSGQELVYLPSQSCDNCSVPIPSVFNLKKAVEWTNIASNIGDPNYYNIKFVVIDGDLTDSAEMSEFGKAKEILDTLNIPWVPVMGNHDVWPNIGDDRAPRIQFHDDQWYSEDWYYNYMMSDAYSNFSKYIPTFNRSSEYVEDVDSETSLNIRRSLQNFAFSYGGWQFIGLDFNDRGSGNESGPTANDWDITGGTWHWLLDSLDHYSKNSDSEKVILLSHHPMYYYWPWSPWWSFSSSSKLVEDLYQYKDIINTNFYGHLHGVAGYDKKGPTGGSNYYLAVKTDENYNDPHVRIVQVFPDGTLDYDTILPEDAVSIIAHCPVDLILTDPDGLVVSRTENQIPDAMYYKWDFDEDGRIDTKIWIAERKAGTYSIQVIPESYANESDTFTLTVSPMEHKWGYTPITIAQNICISDIPSEPYTFEFTQRTATNISYTGDVSGYNLDTINLAAALSAENSSPLSGKTVNFTIGNQSASAATDINGVATVSLMLNQTYGGLCSIEYGFDGDIDYLPYYDAQPFVIPPVADTGGPYTGSEGSPITLDGGGTYDPEDRVISYEWDMDNDGVFDDAAGVMPSYAWNDDYADYIGLKVTDAGGAISMAITEVTVNNVPPTVTAGADINNVITGTAVNFGGSFIDPGVGDTHTVEWDFGDGSPTVNGTLTPSHIYTASGEYTVTLTVTDDDGGVGAGTLSVSMAPSTATYTFAGGGGVDKWCSAGHVHLIDWNNGHPHSPSDLAASPTYGFISGGSAEYTQLSSSDDVRWRSDISHCLGCCAFDRNAELFTFKINEDPATITNIQIKWEGHGTIGETIYYTTEKLWNAASNSWSTLNNKKNITGDITWTNNISSGCSNYIDDSGNLNILLAAQRSGLPKNCGMWTDYIEVTITYN